MKKNYGFALVVLFALPCFSIAQVGINTATPAPNVGLHIVNGFESIRLDGASPFISFYDGNDYRGYLYMTGDNMYLYNRKAGSIFLGTNNSQRIAISSTGSIGIGTSNPDTRLHVAIGSLAGGTFNANTIAGFEKGTGNGYLSVSTGSSTERGILFGDQSNNAAGGIIYNGGSTPNGLQFRTNGNLSRMVIDDVGDVGIGVTNPNRPLHIKSRNGGDEYGIKIERSGSTVNWEMSVFQGNFCFFYNGAQSATATINTSGTYSSSDRRLKQEIAAYHNVLAGVKKLGIKTYRYRADTEQAKQVVGLIAQEVAPLFPEIVLATPNRDGELYYSIDYGKTGVLALKAIQELSAALEKEQEANDDLQQKITVLEQQQRDLIQRLEALERNR